MSDLRWSCGRLSVSADLGSLSVTLRHALNSQRMGHAHQNSQTANSPLIVISILVVLRVVTARVPAACAAKHCRSRVVMQGRTIRRNHSALHIHAGGKCAGEVNTASQFHIPLSGEVAYCKLTRLEQWRSPKVFADRDEQITN